MSYPRPEGALLVRTIDSPVGPLGLAASAAGLLALRFGPIGSGAAEVSVSDAIRSRNASIRFAGGILETAARQLEAYFAGELRNFTVSLDLMGTPFQMSVWTRLRTIPYGARSTYGELARRLGDPNLARAVGAASGANPVGIIVPCHRLVGSDGDLTGFAGGLHAKQALLRHEEQSTTPDLFGAF